MSKNRLFNTVKTPRVSVNKFDLSHDKKLSASMGNLYPILCQEVVPGDRFRITSDMLVRCMPMSSPAFGNLRAYVHYFFVPNRLIWDDWEEFITGGETGVNNLVAPYITYGDYIKELYNRVSNPKNVGIGYLPDYFGIPVSDYVADVPESQVNSTPISLLPFKAYGLIWNEYYRDQNIDEEIDIFPSQTGRQLIDSSKGRFPFDYHLFTRRRRFLKDYFTSALPTPQRGPDVTLPLGGEADVSYFSDPSDPTRSSRFISTNGTISAGVDVANLSFKRDPQTEAPYQELLKGDNPLSHPYTFDPNGTLKADLSNATAVTINDLRRAISLQRFYEISARSGSRYIEQILGHFHVRSSDARLQRPEYLGGGVSPIQIGEVLQTSSTDTESPQGNMAGRGIGFGRSNRCSYFAEEHGYIIGMLSIVPESTYFQGVNKAFTRLSRDDYYWPSFAHLGEQPIMKSELFCNYSTDTSKALFGYAPRYSDYKYVPNTLHGLMRTELSNWTFARSLTQANLNSEFLEIPDINNPFAVHDGGDRYVLWVSHRISALRPMPFFGTPSII